MTGPIVDAINGRRLLAFTYHGYERLVVPAAYGPGGEGRDILDAYQVGGGSRSGPLPQWRTFYVDEMHGVVVLDETFDGPPDGYAPNGGRPGDRYAAL